MATTNHQNQIIKKTFSTRLMRRAVKTASSTPLLSTTRINRAAHSSELLYCHTFILRQPDFCKSFVERTSETGVSRSAPGPFRIGLLSSSGTTTLPSFIPSSTNFFRLLGQTHRPNFCRSHPETGRAITVSSLRPASTRSFELFAVEPATQKSAVASLLPVGRPTLGRAHLPMNDCRRNATENRGFRGSGPLVSFVPGDPEESVRLDSTGGPSTRFSPVFSFSP